MTAPQPATHLTFFEPTHLPFGQSEQSEMKQLLLFFIISLQLLLDRKNNQTGLNTDIISNKIFRPCNFGTVVALFSLSHLSQLVAGRVAACFDSGRQRQALVLQNMFSQKALLTQVIQSIQCQSWERLAIQGRAQI